MPRFIPSIPFRPRIEGFIQGIAMSFRRWPLPAWPFMRTRTFLIFRRLVLGVPAGLLIWYHTLTLYGLYLGPGTHAPTTYDHVQAVLRLAIASSLLLVILGRRWALFGMWASISGLVATHYWAHFGNLPVDFTQGRHPLSYLKGFIFPTLITWAFPPSSKVGDSRKEG